jgi:hypothetical protein
MRRVIVGLAVVAVVALGVGAFVAWPRGASPVTEDEALESFRAQTGGSATDTDPEASHLPAPGVYAMDSTGEEVVKLGVLPAETRTYPKTMSIVVVDSGPSCFTMTLNLLDQHTEDTTYCVGDTGGLRIDSHVKHQKIGALSPTASMTCDPDQLVTPDGGAADPTCKLSLSGGPAQLSATLTGTTEVSDASIQVGSSDIDALVVDVTYQITGDLTGTWHEKIWFAADNWLPVRIERALDLNGLATFTERSTLQLTDTSPRR